MKIFLDDIRNPDRIYPDTKNEDWVIARSYKEFTEILQNHGIPDLVSFDHDIASFDDEGKELTGSSAAEFLIYFALDNNYKKPIAYRVHSSNPSGALNITSKMESFRKIIS